MLHQNRYFPHVTLRQQLRFALALVVVLLLSFVTTLAPQRKALSASVAHTPVSLGEITVEAARYSSTSTANTLTVDREEVLWLARAIYSETKKPHEQELVAWVIRNRVETGYRGNDSFKEAVLDPWQFSAFNQGSPKRQFYMNLGERSAQPGWKVAVGIAERVAKADAGGRPFSETTRHFYSEQSMVGRRAPVWAVDKLPVKLDRKIDPRRFRFYDGVS
jgi:hypothetical protein